MRETIDLLLFNKLKPLLNDQYLWNSSQDPAPDFFVGGVLHYFNRKHPLHIGFDISNIHYKNHHKTHIQTTISTIKNNHNTQSLKNNMNNHAKKSIWTLHARREASNTHKKNKWKTALSTVKARLSSFEETFHHHSRHDILLAQCRNSVHAKHQPYYSNMY